VFRLVGVFAISVGMAFGAPTADELIRQVQDRYNGVRTLSVDFRMEDHHRPPEEGKLTLRKQGKMRWDYSKPAGKLFVADGKTVYLYSARDNKVEKVPLKDTEDMRAPLAFLLGHLDLRKEFRNFATRPGGEEDGTWLVASAKSDRAPYEQIDMLIAPDGSVRHLKVAGRDQSEIDFYFKEERLNPPVSDALFHFTIPPGAEVVDAIEFGVEK
jgi:outer membrane lipoprotein carrier protein